MIPMAVHQLVAAADRLLACEDAEFLCHWLSSMTFDSDPEPPAITVRRVMALRMIGRGDDARSVLHSCRRRPRDGRRATSRALPTSEHGSA